MTMDILSEWFKCVLLARHNWLRCCFCPCLAMHSGLLHGKQASEAAALR
jgi:hypothetical protein